MEVWAEAPTVFHLLTLGFNGLEMSLVECYGEYQVRCPQNPEFEEVTLSRTREQADQQFIDFFFAVAEMVRER